MFWNEFEPDCTITTVMDESGTHEDVQLIIDDKAVWLRQFNNPNSGADLIMLTPKMFQDLLQALNHTEGMYKTVYRPKEM